MLLVNGWDRQVLELSGSIRTMLSSAKVRASRAPLKQVALGFGQNIRVLARGSCSLELRVR